jgi:hypothetical protein
MEGESAAALESVIPAGIRETDTISIQQLDAVVMRGFQGQILWQRYCLKKSQPHCCGRPIFVTVIASHGCTVGVI